MSFSTIREKMVLVHLDISIWSGQTKLDAADLRLADGSEIPPERLAKLGQKVIFPPSKLKVFNSIKMKAKRALESRGEPFFGCYACPFDEEKIIIAELQGIMAEFKEQRQEIIADYDAIMSDFINDPENAEWADILRRSAKKLEDIKDRISFDFSTFKLQSTPETEEDLNRKLSGLGEKLISKAVDEASSFFKDYIGRRTDFPVKARQRLKNLRNKMSGLQFLNANAGTIVELMDEALQHFEYSQGAKLPEDAFWNVMAPIVILSDRNKFESFLDNEITIESMHSAIVPKESKEAMSAIPKPMSLFTPTLNSMKEIEIEEMEVGIVSASVITPSPLDSLSDSDWDFA